MTNFVISATLDEDKNLNLTNVPAQNQGENNCSAIHITVPQHLAEGAEFYLEFLCPKNKRYISPQLARESSPGIVLLKCQIPSCVLQEEGLVAVQLIARSTSDGTVVYKSNYSNRAAFWVHPSVNAAQMFTVADYFAKTEGVLNETKNTLQEICELQDGMQGYLEDLDATIDNKVLVACNEKVASFAQSLSLESLRRENDVRHLNERMNNHEQTQNPHGLDKTLIGLHYVDNVRQYSAQNPNFGVTLPTENGIAATGTATTYSRSDHVHPSDSTKADAAEVVKISQQVLTSEQKQQARQNIGAGTSNFSGDYNDLINKPNLVGGGSGGASNVIVTDCRFTDVDSYTLGQHYGLTRAYAKFDRTLTTYEMEICWIIGGGHEGYLYQDIPTNGVAVFFDLDTMPGAHWLTVTTLKNSDTFETRRYYLPFDTDSPELIISLDGAVSLEGTLHIVEYLA